MSVFLKVEMSLFYRSSLIISGTIIFIGEKKYAQVQINSLPT